LILEALREKECMDIKLKTKRLGRAFKISVLIAIFSFAPLLADLVFYYLDRNNLGICTDNFLPATAMAYLGILILK
jgi:hypothetical protein